MGTSEFRAAYCPYCGARQWLFGYKLPREASWTCPRCKNPFALDAKTYGDAWGSVFAVWSASIFAVLWGWMVLTSAPSFLKMVLGLLTFVPIASIALAAPFAMLGSFLGRYVAAQWASTPKESGLRRVSYQPKQTEDKEPPEAPEAPGRSYVHNACGCATEVSGEDFERLANPFTFVSQTYCAECAEHVSLKSVRWEDSGEPITRYRARVRRDASPRVKLIGYVVGPGAAFLLGAGVVQLFGGDTLATVIGGMTGTGFAVAFLAPHLVRWLGGVDFREIP